MSRSGYVEDMDDQWALIRWRGAVNSAIRGKRGQAFLREMFEAMEALPEKKLIAHELEADGEFCAIGTVGHARGIDMSALDPEDAEAVADAFGIAPALAREIVFENDEVLYGDVTPERRFQYVRGWIFEHLKKDTDTQDSDK